MRTELIIRPIVRAITAPRAKKVLRAAGSVAPYLGTFAVAAAAYRYSTDFRQTVDGIRGFLNQSPRAFESATSAITLGFLPDLAAQRYEGKDFSWRRLIGMTALGGATGGFLVRGLYDLQGALFPGSGAGQTIRKILFDQGLYTPFFLTLYFTVTNFVKGETWRGFPAKLRRQLVEIIPKNWCYWGLIGLPIVYNLPSDLMVYLANFFAMGWFAYLSRTSHDVV